MANALMPDKKKEYKLVRYPIKGSNERLNKLAEKAVRDWIKDNGR